jgi:CheY-like chemotaxis protein
MLAVTDTGTGMDEETQRRIFEPFYTTKPIGKGTGLGLSTVYGIVKQMAGLVYVYSEVGKGTCFKIYFPLVEAHTPEDAPVAVSRQQFRGDETILLVEDDEHVREATRRILASGGYRVLVADNGPHAVELAKEQQGRIHLMISDVVMPGMSGREVLDQVRQYSVPHVLFMSGYTDDSVVNHGILEGDFPFLHKPFSRDALLKKVRTVLGSPAMGQVGPEDDQGT